MARPGATHRTTAPSCTPATRDRSGRLRREVHGGPAACRNPGLLDDSGLASASRPWSARGPQAPARQPGHPGARSSSPAASGRPGRAPVHPCAVTLDQLHRKGDGPRAAGTTDGRRQRTTAIQEDPVGGMSAFPACSGVAIIFWGAALSSVSRIAGHARGFAGCSGGSGCGAGRGGRRSYGRGSRVCPDSRRRARCRSRGGHQIAVVPRVLCALAGLVLTVAVAADSVSAALWSLTRAGWLPVPGVAQPGPQGARRTSGSKPHACSLGDLAIGDWIGAWR